ncbi:MAG: hypothetical protein JSS72_04630 [Armatimonadetes bacterium]|nr:hypothetical protein [Armatimonadota bacterium]
MFRRAIFPVPSKGSGPLRSWPFLFALCIVLCSTFYAGLTFGNLRSTEEIPGLVLLIKSLTFLASWGLGHCIDWLIREIRGGNVFAARWLKFGAPYFAFNMLLLLLTWPGTYRLDEFSIIYMARHWELDYWQHYLTSLFYMVSWNIIPLINSPIVFETLLASAVVGYLVAFYYGRLPNKRLSFLFFLPFMMPPVLDNNLYPMRSTPWTYLIAGVIAWLVTLGPHKALNSPKRVILLILTLSVVGSWRSEAIILLPVLMTAALAYTWKDLNKVSRFAIAIGPLVGMQLLNIPQKLDAQMSNNRYEVTSFVGPVAPLILADEKNPSKAAVMTDLGRLFNFKPFHRVLGGEAFWEGGVRKEYTNGDFLVARNAFLREAMVSPGLVFQERWDNFSDSLGFGGYCHVRNSAMIFHPLFDKGMFPFIVKARSTWPLFQPFNLELRKDVVSYLQMRPAGDATTPMFGSVLLYNGAPAFVLTLLALIRGAKRRQVLVVGASIAMLLCACGVFLTAPQSFFFYYFYLYVGGPVLLLLSEFEAKLKRENVRANFAMLPAEAFEILSSSIELTSSARRNRESAGVKLESDERDLKLVRGPKG